jgi:hypothetical protein
MNGGNNKWKHAQIKNDKSNNFIISKKHYLREAKKKIVIKAWQINNMWFQEKQRSAIHSNFRHNLQ